MTSNKVDTFNSLHVIWASLKAVQPIACCDPAQYDSVDEFFVWLITCTYACNMHEGYTMDVLRSDLSYCER